MKTQEIANLISIRNFLTTSIDNMQIKLSRDEIKKIQTRVQYLDKTILEYSLKLDLTNLGQEHTIVRELSVTSTEDTEKVLRRFTDPFEGPKEDSKKVED